MHTHIYCICTCTPYIFGMRESLENKGRHQRQVVEQACSDIHLSTWEAKTGRSRKLDKILRLSPAGATQDPGSKNKNTSSYFRRICNI